MHADALDIDEIISHFSHRPEFLSKATITIAERPKPVPAELDLRSSSLGTLDRLPLELIQAILGMLDLGSLARLSRVCYGGRVVVESLHGYRALLDIAPSVIAALSQTKLLGLHPVSLLRDALRSDRCDCCSRYGEYLFLLTCKRCCWECLHVHPSLRAIPPREAVKYFGLTERDVKRLPTLFSVPGSYNISARHSSISHPLVSASAAREMGISLFGSIDSLASNLAARCREVKSLVTGRFLQGIFIERQGTHPHSLPGQGAVPPDSFFGMAAIAFPSQVAAGPVEHGLWCKGCYHTYDLHRCGRLPPDALSSLVPPECGPERVLLGLARRARSRTEFLQHVRHCYGAQRLIRT